ncbi:MAG: MFS transporter [Actinomycetota bacterium]|nr:MFS transporter [Actinomycetota bacterium]
MDLGALGQDPADDPFGVKSRRMARRNIVPLVGGQAVSLFGDYIAFFSLPYFVLALTAQPLDLGLTAAAETLPMFLFGLIAGVLLDRLRNLRLALVTVDLLRAIVFIALAVAAANGAGTRWLVFGVAFVIGTMSVFFDSGLQAMMPSVVDEDMLIDVNSHMAVARMVTLSIGPLAGGMLIAFSGGFAIAFFINAATFLVSAVFLTRVKVIHERPVTAREPFMESLKEGLAHLFGDSRLRWATLGGTFTNLVFQPLEALLVLFVVTEILDLPADTIGDLTTVGVSIGVFYALNAGIGAIGAALAPRVSSTVPLGTMYVTGLFLVGGGFLVLAIMRSFWAVIPAGLAFAGMAWVNVALVTMRQRLTPPELLGRVIAASRTLAWLGLPLGAALGGMIAGFVGVIPVYIGGSALVIVIAGFLLTTPLVRDPVMADPENGIEY